MRIAHISTNENYRTLLGAKFLATQKFCLESRLTTYRERSAIRFLKELSILYVAFGQSCYSADVRRNERRPLCC